MQIHFLVAADKIEEFAINRDCDSDEWNHSGNCECKWPLKRGAAIWGEGAARCCGRGDQEENENPLCVG